MRFLIAFVFALGAAALIGTSGGISVLSPDDWLSIREKWTLPSTSENERCLTLLAGLIVSFLALARLLTPFERRISAS